MSPAAANVARGRRGINPRPTPGLPSPGSGGAQRDASGRSVMPPYIKKGPEQEEYPRRNAEPSRNLMSAPETTSQPETSRRQQLLPPYAVILHNDDVNEMGYVTMALLRSVPNLTSEQAVEIMMTAHLHGQAVVIVCPLELAELYRERLEGYGLTATIEKA